MFYQTSAKSGIRPEHAKRLTLLLQLLDAAQEAKHLDLPGFYFHELKGNLKEYYSLRVNGNWRVVFEFKQHHAYQVDYLDYH